MDSPGRRLRIAALVSLGMVAVAGLLWLRARYDVIRTIDAWTDAIVTTWRYAYGRAPVATSEAIQAEIQTARADALLASLPRNPTAGPLEVDPSGSGYFVDSAGRTVYLTGSHTWATVQDNGHGYPPPAFDFEQYLDFVSAHGHNFLRLWTWESPRWSVQSLDGEYWFFPMPFRRVGPERAQDGHVQFDLTQFDPLYFQRLSERVRAARDRGIYVSVMLFNGWSATATKPRKIGRNTWRSHPFARGNNVNGIDADLNGDESGEELHELGDPSVLALQELYTRRVVEAVNDFDNVLFEISNESHAESLAWQIHMALFIKTIERDLGTQHPVGITVPYPGGSDAALLAAPVDWISPTRPEGLPLEQLDQVVIADTDHIFGIGGDWRWAWKNFFRGYNPVFMDGYDGWGYGTGGARFEFGADEWKRLRRALGYTRWIAEAVDLALLEPAAESCPAVYCLMPKRPTTTTWVLGLEGGESVHLEAEEPKTSLAAIWLDPLDGRLLGREAVTWSGGRIRVTPPCRQFLVVVITHVDARMERALQPVAAGALQSGTVPAQCSPDIGG